MKAYEVYIRNKGEKQYFKNGAIIKSHEPLEEGKHTTPYQYTPVSKIDKIEYKNGLKVYLTRKEDN